MAESVEHMTARLGLDASAFTIGQAKMLDSAKKSSMEYVGFWESALSKKDAADAAFNDKSILRAKEASEAKILADKQWMEAYAARIREKEEIDAIGKGSGGYGSIPVAGGRGRGSSGMGGMVGGQIAGDLASGASEGDMERSAEAMGAMGLGMLMGKSIERQIHRLFRVIVKSAIGRAVLVAAAAVGGWKVGQFINDEYINKPLEESNEQTAKTREMMGKRLEHEIEKSVKAGKISESEGEYLKGQTGSFTGIKRVQKAMVGKLVDDAEEKRNTKLAEVNARTARQRQENYLASLHDQDRMNNLLMEQHAIEEKVSSTKKGTIEHAEALLDLADKQKEVQKLGLEIEKKRDELQKSFSSEQNKLRGIQHESGMIDNEVPTIAELAGRGFMSRLDKAYGKGGQYDLGKGDGPFSADAQQAALAAKQQMWDVMHGNAQFDSQGVLIGGAAFEDRKRRIGFENKLRGAGLDTPEMKQAKMALDMAEINSNIGKLLHQAAEDGIVLKDKP